MEFCNETLDYRIRTMANPSSDLDPLAHSASTKPKAPNPRMNDHNRSNQPSAESKTIVSEFEDEIDWKAVIEILDDITSGLIYVHSKRFVHRDLKPTNGKTIQEQLVIKYSPLFSEG